MNFSAKIKLRRPARRDGTCTILLQVIVGRAIWPKNLDLSWPELLFDESTNTCLASLPPAAQPPSYQKVLEKAIVWAGGTAAALAKRAKDYNMLVGQALAKANEVQVRWRLSSEVLTLERFRRDYETAGDKSDFITYYRAKVTERFRRSRITEITRKNHLSTLNALVAFRPCIPFNSLTTDFAEEFDEYLKKHVKGINTRWSRHKDVKTYLALAKKDRLKFENPYEYFVNRSEPGKWKALLPDELRKLEAYYVLCTPGSPQRRILCKFLFSCKSGLRLGDLKNIGNSQLEGNRLTFEMQKGWNQRLKATMLPLTRQALSYLDDAQQEEGTAGFRDYSDQYENRALTAIGLQLGIDTKLHHHVGRETFATTFIRLGGSVAILQKLMNHSKIATTMKYVHVDDEMKCQAIEALDAKLID